MLLRICQGFIKIIVVLQGLFLIVSQSASQGVQEYCAWDKFEATCAPGEVVVMRTARYGRMKLGKCVKKNFGYSGCAADVLSYMDRLCSGKRKCSLDVPDKTMKDMRPCSELEAYLEASYDCVKVAKGSSRMCQRQHRITLTKPTGIIPSVAADEHGYGTRSCPWVVQAPKGQRINITLQDFGLAVRMGSDSARFASSLVCQRYAVLKEAESKSSTVCGGERRVKNIYISDTNTVQVEVIPSRAPTATTEFLLLYSVIGCADPDVSNGVESTRTGDTVEVTCLKTGDKWTLTCQGNAWIGQRGNCSEADPWDIWQVLADDWTSPHGILIVACLGVGLGIIIGVTLLAIALICMKRRRCKRDTEHIDGCVISGDVDMGPRQDSMCTNDCSSAPLVKIVGRPLGGGAGQQHLKESEYDYRWQQTRPLVPIPADQMRAHGDKGAAFQQFHSAPFHDSTLSRQMASTYQTREENDHIYESPN